MEWDEDGEEMPATPRTQNAKSESKEIDWYADEKSGGEAPRPMPGEDEREEILWPEEENKKDENAINSDSDSLNVEETIKTTLEKPVAKEG